MSLRVRIYIALVIGLLGGLLCYAALARRSQAAADFTFAWRAARALLAGQNPYKVIRPEGEYPYQTYFYYPLTAALAALPFAALPALPAGALFFGISSALLAFAITGKDIHHLAIFLGAPYWVALGVAQWSPLIAAAALAPGLGWLLACKPTLGAAGLVARPNRRTPVGIAIFSALSLVILPTWPLDWLQKLAKLEGHPPALLVLPFGPLLMLATLRLRTPAGRTILAMAALPQLLFFYDQILLGFIPRTFKTGLLLAGLSWAGYFAWRLVGVNPADGQITLPPTQFVLAAIYLPTLALALLDGGPQPRRIQPDEQI